MEEDYLKLLVDRYLNKTSTDEELEIFVHLMKQGKLDRYLEEAMDNELMEITSEHIAPEKSGWLMKLRWPLAAALCFAISVLGYLSLKQPAGPATANLKNITFQNLKANVCKVILPDSSMVWLNPGATLAYPSAFTGKLRQVTMVGEAFFEVTKDPEHPFVILSGKIKTKVWGTSFRIRAIPGEKDTKVSVLTGKVTVSASADEVSLLPHEEATYKANDSKLVKAAIPESSDVIVWRKANLSFENTALSQIAAELNNFYHVQIHLDGEKLKAYELTADFNGKNLNEILILICKSVHADYSQKENEILVRTTTNPPL